MYAAGEPPLPGVSGAMIVERARQQGMRHVEHAADHAAAVTAVVAEARAGDLVLTLGAGDVWHIGEDVLRGLGRSPTRVGQGT